MCHLTQEMGGALVPGYRRPNKGQNVYQKKHFTYEPERDVYVCPADTLLTYSTTDRNGYRHYRSDARVCVDCPLRDNCTKNQKREKTLTRHVWEEAKEKMNALWLTKWGKKVYARRKETVHRQFRKLTKTKGAFPNENSLLKLLLSGADECAGKMDNAVPELEFDLVAVSHFF